MAVASGIAFQEAASGVGGASLRTTAGLAPRAWPAGEPAPDQVATHKLSA